MPGWTAEDLAGHYKRLREPVPDLTKSEPSEYDARLKESWPPGKGRKPAPAPTGCAPWTPPMNGTERAYDAYLRTLYVAGEVLWWAFEGMKIILGPGATYTPDFLVLYADGRLELHDTKGTKKIKTGRKAGEKTCWVEEHALVKCKITTAVFPIPLFLVYSLGDGGWGRKGFGE